MNAAAADYQALKQQRVRKNELATADCRLLNCRPLKKQRVRKNELVTDDCQLPTSNCRTAKKQRVRKNELAKNILISNF